VSSRPRRVDRLTTNRCAWGDGIARTFAVLWLLQGAWEIQLATQSMGRPLAISEEIQAKCTADSLQFNAYLLPDPRPSRIRCGLAARRRVRAHRHQESADRHSDALADHCHNTNPRVATADESRSLIGASL
jgi:hypothetical protein